MERIDWETIERHALRSLGLLPKDFWALTPREYQVLAGTETLARPMTRLGLEALEDAVSRRRQKEE